MNRAPSGGPTRQYAVQQVSMLLGRLVFEVRRCLRSPDSAGVHDVRVAIRRFSQSLRIFGRLLPAREAKKVRKRLDEVLDLAAQVRDRDVTLQLLEEGGLPVSPALRAKIGRERKEGEVHLTRMLRSLDRQSFSSKWRAGLHLVRR